MKSFRNRFLIAVDSGCPDLLFFNNSGILLAVGYERVVIGKRGPYVEFTPEQIKWEAFIIPPSEAFRATNNVVFYLEYRSNDTSWVKLYRQKRTVAYADYKIGLCYISPLELLRAEMLPLLT